MRVLVLSSHPFEKAKEAERKRMEDWARALRKHQNRKLAREGRLRGLKKRFASAWESNRFWHAVQHGARFVRTWLTPAPPEPRIQPPNEDEERWTAGASGERLVADYLTTSLSDDWTLMLGYSNARGEIDQLLVGPHGVFAVEVKFINGEVYCDGDRWWRDKYDNYGNLVEEGLPIADRSGRGPSAQLNEAADLLEEFLTERSDISGIRRAIVFAHDRSRIGEIKRPTIDCVATIHDWDLQSFLGASDAGIRAMSARGVVELIKTDHHLHREGTSLGRRSRGERAAMKERRNRRKRP